jgi:hypothetical protein
LPWNPTYPKLEEIHKVLLVRQDRIGDVILTLPLITELKIWPRWNWKRAFLMRWV